LVSQCVSAAVPVHGNVGLVLNVNGPHDAEPRVSLYVALRVHPAGGVAHERLDVRKAGLPVAAGKVRLGPLGDPYGESECVVPVLDAGLEGVGVQCVQM